LICDAAGSPPPRARKGGALASDRPRIEGRKSPPHAANLLEGVTSTVA